MSRNIILLILLLFSFFELSAQLIGQWSATVTDAVSNQCSNGSIDLHPPSNGNSYTYIWSKTGSFFHSFSEDLTDLSPGQYNVSISGPLCDDLNLSYFVGLKEYNFDIRHIQPSECEPGRNVEFNGAILITWNDDVLPAPIILQSRTGNLVNNNVWITNLGPGIHTFEFSVDGCEWTYQLELCCCSVTEDFPLPGTSSLCDNVNDEIPFSIQTNLVIGSSGPNARDGKIRVLINSPGPDPSITWRGPIPGNPIESFEGNYIQNLLPGEYCYDYKDDCHAQSECIIVDDCDFPMSINVISSRASCYTKTDGVILFDIRTTENSQREFSVYDINADGSTGSKYDNLTIDRSHSQVLSRILIENLAPGDYKFRIITSQLCEGEISFNIPAIIGDWDNFDNETCSRDVYCGGDLVAREFLIPERIASEFCFINRFLCPMPGASPIEVSTYDQSSVSQIEYNSDDGTCSFLYYCVEENSFQGVNGEIFYEELEYDCKWPTEEPPSGTFTRICRFSYSDDIVIDVPIVAPNYVTNGSFVNNLNECGDCIYDSRLSKAVDKLYSFSDPSGNEIGTIDCCRLCNSRPEVIKGKSSNSLPASVECILQSEMNSLKLLNIGTGRHIALSGSQLNSIIQSLKKGNIVISSKIGNSLAPGTYVLSSPKCQSTYVTVL